MDDIFVQNHLQIMIWKSVRAAGVCTKFLDILDKTPLSSLCSTQKVEKLEGRIVLYQEEEKRLQGEVTWLKEERSQLQKRKKKLMAQCAMAEGLKEKAEQNYVRVFTENIDLQRELEKGREAYQDLEDSVAESSEKAWRIFKEQVKVIAPDLDLSALDPDKIVVNGAIVSPPRPEMDSELKTRGQRLIESPPREDQQEGSQPTSSDAPTPAAEETAPSSPAADPTSLPTDDSNPSSN
ncbi:uncharacterized protein LOC107484870 [Arachis duranensis]|uniref:Uncharacterized protein LOC107484870 n=1 Tax=Arachis duranensis TaxID=130453 RepID=A0A6P4D4S2_ARADU|nr:uncharacterized protein LOC107484870 [Arachis duranensis]